MASGSKKQAAPAKPRTKSKPIEPLDWRELASGPALRGLNDVLGGPTPPVGVPRAIIETPDPPTDPVIPPSGYTTRWVAPDPPWVDATGVLHEAKRVRAIKAAEESMTMGEERFYQSVWNAAADLTIESENSRTFTLGYDRLAKLVRLDEKSVRQLIPKLVFKRIIEVVAMENSSERVGRTYRIFSGPEILRRQRAAGLQHIVKKGRAVEFVWPSGHQAPSMPFPTPCSTTVGVSLSPTDPWSSAVDGALREFGVDPDAALVRALVANCRQNSTDATIDEIVYFIHERGRVLRKRPVSNPAAYLMVSVPSYFDPETLRSHREEVRNSTATASSVGQKAKNELLSMRAEWEAWLTDPAVSQSDRQWAKQMLAKP